MPTLDIKRSEKINYTLKLKFLYSRKNESIPEIFLFPCLKGGL